MNDVAALPKSNREAVLSAIQVISDHREAASKQQIVGKHGGFHAGAAHFVDGCAAYAVRDAGSERGLTRGRLPLTGRQYVTHDDFVDLGAGDTGSFEGGLDGNGA